MAGKPSEVLNEEGKTASRSAMIAALKVGETFSLTEYLEPDVRAEHVQEVMNDVRKDITQRISSTLKYCQGKTGNKYSRETLTGITTQGRFAVTLIIERTA